MGAFMVGLAIGMVAGGGIGFLAGLGLQNVVEKYRRRDGFAAGGGVKVVELEADGLPRFLRPGLGEPFGPPPGGVN